MQINFIPREEIDKVKWNSCVHYANNGNVFGYMWYLDFVAKEWDALVEGDYESVFPLVWRSGLVRGKELYQPYLMRELGIYSINVLSPKRMEAFLQAIPEEYRHIDITVNEQNLPPKETAFKVEEKVNHQLLLNLPYEELENNFTPERKEVVKKIEEAGLKPSGTLKPEKIAEFYKKYSKDGTQTDPKFHALQRIMYNVLHRGWGFAAGVEDDKGELLAVDFFIYSHGRMMSLVPVTSPAGKEKNALVYLYNMILHTQANRPLLLDFNTNQVDPFALGFGAKPNNYYRIKKDKRLLGIL